MINILFWIVIGGLISSILVGKLCLSLGIHLGYGIALLLLFAVGSYFGCALLMKYYMNRRAPGLLEMDEVFPDGEHAWEKTAGTGIVPKWVSFIGLASYAFILGVLLLLLPTFNK